MRASSSCFFFRVFFSGFLLLVDVESSIFFGADSLSPSIDCFLSFSPHRSTKKRPHLRVRLPRLHHGQALGHVVRDEVDGPAHGQGLVGRDGRRRRRAADGRRLLFVAATAAADDGRAAAHARSAQAPADAAVFRVRAVARGGRRGPAADLQGARRAGEMRSAAAGTGGGIRRAVFFRDGVITRVNPSIRLSC